MVKTWFIQVSESSQIVVKFKNTQINLDLSGTHRCVNSHKNSLCHLKKLNLPKDALHHLK